MNYFAIFRSDTEKPVIFVQDYEGLKLGKLMDELNAIKPGICYRTEPRTLEEVAEQKAGH
jgi:hypothetical protein